MRIITHKTLENTRKKADAAADIALINRYSRKTLKPEEVFVFSLILCDNSIDRDHERFTDASLDALAPLFVGKTTISDHQWSAEKQIARIYRTEVEIAGKRNSLGESLRVLRADAYMLNNETNKPIIESIDGGVHKEISVACGVSKRTCSICGGELIDCSHKLGERYGGKLCYGNLENPTDAYEASFVAVGAQPGAGVTKSVSFMSEAEKDERARLIEEAKSYQKNGEKPIKKEPEKMIKNQTPNDHPTLPVAAKAAYWRASLLQRDKAAVLLEHKSLGAIPGTGEHLLPRNLSRVILTEPSARNPLRQIERVSQISNLSVPLISYEILEETLADVTDDDTAREVELATNLIEFGKFKTKINVVLSDTVIHGGDENLSSTIEEALRSGLAEKELINAFRTVSNGANDHMSFYLNDITMVAGPNLIHAVINGLTDLPGKFINGATVVMRRQDYLNAVMSFNNGALWGKKPENIFSVPCVFCDAAVIPVIGDFNFAQLNYDFNIYFEQDKDAREGLYYFVLTAWGDHMILTTEAFRLVEVNP